MSATEGGSASIPEVCVVGPNTEYLFIYVCVCVDKDVLHVGLLYGLEVSNRVN